ncbi:amino acid adenylation domain-containing protein [Streptomyces seoulensis]
MTENLADLSAEERERLLDLLQDEAADGPSDRIPAAAAHGPAPASYAQRRLWFVDRFDPGNPAYNVPLAARITGDLDLDALAAALRTVVDRHAALRTAFRETDGEPVQVVAERAAIELPVLDPEQAGPVDEWITAETHRVFDLTEGPLLRAAVLREAADSHVLLLVAHHAVVDGWSLGVVMRELGDYYAQSSEGRTVEQAAPPVQYADFAAWQRGRLDDGAHRADLEYWRTSLHGAPPVLTLPQDRPAPGAERYAGEVCSARVPAGTLTGLRALGASGGASTFMIVLAAFQLLLGRLAGTEDVVVGVPTAGRSRPELADAVGCFLNTLALRADLGGEPTFRGLVERVSRSTLAAYEHQDLPFEHLVEELRPERGAAHTPFFQVMFNHTNTVETADRLGPLPLEFLEPSRPPAKFPLTLYARETGEELVLQAVFQTALYRPERVDHLLGQLVRLLEQAAAAPDTAVSRLSLVLPARERTLPDPARPQKAEPQPTVRDLVHAQLVRAPEATAVECGAQRWSYAELWERAEAVRTALGLRPDSAERPVVAVSGHRSPALAAAMLAVLAGGGVLVTVDRQLPRLRQQSLLSRSGATRVVLVTAPEDGEDSPLRRDGLGVLEVDRDTGLPLGGLGPYEPGRTYGSEAGYLFFTSGTTGVPKGVLGRESGLAHFLTWQRDTFQVGAGDRTAFLTGLSFDVVLRDLLLPLVSGATLCVPERGDELLPGELPGWLARERITVLHTVPALATAWLAERPAGDTGPTTLRLAFFAGEPLTDTLVERWRAAHPDSAVVNLYGPTETTLAACSWTVPQPPAAGVQPVGRPLPGGQALVLNASGTPCGIGEVGEIVLRTPYRSLGYVSVEEAETDARTAFRPNPATGDPDDLLYHTGDLGRHRLDGTLEILGRRDRQVKIRGVRVEPDEVAAVLARHPGVRRAVVAGTPVRDGEVRLTAYVVAATEPAPTAAQLRGYLGKRLPAAAVPAVCLFLDAVPVTANGKTDWAALPKPEAAAEEEWVAPRTGTEQRLAALMAELLGVDRVGAHSGFFALGGHSLLAMQLVSRIADAFGVTLPLKAVFENPTVAGLAELVDAEAVRADGD